MSEQQATEQKTQVEIEEEEEFFSAEEELSSENDEESEEAPPQRRYVGGKAPRSASKAPIRRTQATKAPRWASKRPNTSRGPKENKIVRRKQNRGGNTTPHLEKTVFVKKTPLGQMLRKKMRETRAGERMRMSSAALELARFYVEQHHLNFFIDVNRAAIHAKRKTIMPKDIIFCRTIKNK